MDLKKLLNNEHTKLLNKLQSYIDNLIAQNNNLRDKLNQWNRDDRIQELEEEISRMRQYSILILNEKEYDDLRQFRRDHYESCKGSTRETVYHSGIGSGVVVKCSMCNKENDITDASAW